MVTLSLELRALEMGGTSDTSFSMISEKFFLPWIMVQVVNPDRPFSLYDAQAIAQPAAPELPCLQLPLPTPFFFLPLFKNNSHLLVCLLLILLLPCVSIPGPVPGTEEAWERLLDPFLLLCVRSAQCLAPPVISFSLLGSAKDPLENVAAFLDSLT